MVFGQLIDIVKSNTLGIDDVADTNGLLTKLNERYPALAGAKYVIAVNKRAINSNTTLDDGSIVALLPPFSGG